MDIGSKKIKVFPILSTLKTRDDSVLDVAEEPIKVLAARDYFIVATRTGPRRTPTNFYRRRKDPGLPDW